MSKNYYWQAFLIVISACALWYTAVAGYRYYGYSRLNTKTPVLTVNWEVEELSDEEFVPMASYSFKAGQESYSGHTQWPDQIYRNHWAAEQALPQFSSDWKQVWYDRDNPSHSSMQKKFPFKEGISAIVLWGLLLYFLWLGVYVSRYKRR